MSNPPNELIKAVEVINSFNRIRNVDPDLVLISECGECGSYFASLPADEAYRKNRGMAPMCRNCARIHKANLLKERKKRYQQKKKLNSPIN